MDNLLLALAAILALNLAFGLRIAISEFFSRRKDRRELGALESMWHQDPSASQREARPRRLVPRTVAAGAAVVILSGAAFATPAREAVISTVGGVVSRLTDDPTTAASAPDTAPAPSPTASTGPEASDRSADGPPHERNNVGEAGDTPTTPSASVSASTGIEPTVDPPTMPEPTVPPPSTVELHAQASPLSATEIVVVWDPLASASTYVVDCSPGCPSGSVTVEAPSAMFTGLNPETTYRFVVTTTTESGLVQADASATTPAVPAE